MKDETSVKGKTLSKIEMQNCIHMLRKKQKQKMEKKVVKARMMMSWELLRMKMMKM